MYVGMKVAVKTSRFGIWQPTHPVVLLTGQVRAFTVRDVTRAALEWQVRHAAA